MRLVLVAATALFAIAQFAAADEARAMIKEPTHIPAEPLGTALQALAKQRGFQLVYVSDEVDRERTQGASGQLTVEEALTQVLRGTGLTFHRLAGNGVGIVPVGSGAPPATPSAEAGKARRSFPDGSFRLAQAASTAPAKAPAVGAAPAVTGQLEEVVVTAEKRSENIMSVPISITAMTGNALEQQGVKNIDDLARIVPGVTLSLQSTATEDETVVIRGISATAGSATTGIYIDDTPIQGREVGTAYPEVFDLARVEVLRGPQGTLFGAGSEGGTVRFITPTPSLTSLSGYSRSEVSFTEDGDPNFETGVAVGAPIVNGVAGVRASVWTRHDGGYIDRYDFFTNTLLGQKTNSADSYVGRAEFLVQPTERLKITPAIYFQRTNRADSDAWWSTKGVYQSYYNIPQPTDEQFYLPSLSVEYQFSAFSVKSITSYFSRQVDNTNEFFHSSKQNLFYAAVPDYSLSDLINESQDNFTQELRFTSSSDQRLRWVGGVFFYSNREGYKELEVEPLANALWLATTGYDIADYFGVPQIDGDISYRDFRVVQEEELAEYANATFDITQRLKITGGVRVSHTQFGFGEYSDGPFGVGGNLQPVQTNGGAGEHPVTPKAGLSYDLKDGVIYASAAKGYRIGGANALLPNICAPELESLGVKGGEPPPYTSDTLKSYEIGFKDRLAGGRMLIAASAFRIDWSHIQGNIPLNSCAYSYTGNFGSAVSQGGDLQVQIQPLSGLQLSGSMAFTDAHYTQTVAVPGTVSQLLVKSGDPLLFTPKWQSDVSATYTWTAHDALEAFVRAEESYSSDYERTYSQGVNGYLASTRHGSPLALASLRCGLRNDTWDASLFVSNLTNNSTPIYETAGTVPGTYGFEAIREMSMRPRTIGVDFTYNF